MLWVPAVFRHGFRNLIVISASQLLKHSEKAGVIIPIFEIKEDARVHGHPCSWSGCAVVCFPLTSCGCFTPRLRGWDLVDFRRLVFFLKRTMGAMDWTFSKPSSALIIIHPGKSVGGRTGWKSSAWIFWDDQKASAETALALWLGFGALMLTSWLENQPACKSSDLKDASGMLVFFLPWLSLSGIACSIADPLNNHMSHQPGLSGALLWYRTDKSPSAVANRHATGVAWQMFTSVSDELSYWKEFSKWNK